MAREKSPEVVVPVSPYDNEGGAPVGEQTTSMPAMNEGVSPPVAIAQPVAPAEPQFDPATAYPKDPGAEFMDVVIQRPPGVTDSHIFIGFNAFEGQFPYDAKVSLPVRVVKHLRGIRRVEYRASDTGLPVASYHNALAVMDA